MLGHHSVIGCVNDLAVIDLAVIDLVIG